MRKSIYALVFGIPVVLLALSGAFCSSSRSPEEPARRAARPAEEKVKVLQFYAAAGAVAPGEKVLLCYGTENAQTVRITPEVESLKPALSRCFETVPGRTTKYTLTAEAPGQPPATASVTVEVRRGARRAVAPQAERASGGPHIVSFRRGDKQEAGVVQLCYEVEGAEAVAVEPGALPRNPALRGCFGVAPKGPTTYTLTAFGAGGQTARREITVAP